MEDWCVTNRDSTPSWSLRDRILLGFGLGGLSTFVIVWVITSRSPPDSLLLACLGLIGAPVALRIDEKRARQGDRDG